MIDRFAAAPVTRSPRWHNLPPDALGEAWHFVGTVRPNYPYRGRSPARYVHSTHRQYLPKHHPPKGPHCLEYSETRTGTSFKTRFSKINFMKTSLSIESLSKIIFSIELLSSKHEIFQTITNPQRENFSKTSSQRDSFFEWCSLKMWNILFIMTYA